MKKTVGLLRYGAASCGTALLLLLTPGAGCRLRPDPKPENHSSVPKRDINAVLKDHDKELMAIPGVVGVYVGMLKDGESLCLRVMAARKTSELSRRVPKSIDGYPVEVEETGVIRPLPGR